MIMSSAKILDIEVEDVKIIVDEIVEKATQIVLDKFQKFKTVGIYHEIFIKVLEEILKVYDMPKPCINFESTITSWKQDRPSQPAIPDSLITPKLFLKSEKN